MVYLVCRSVHGSLTAATSSDDFTGTKKRLGINPHHPESQAGLQTCREGTEVLNALIGVCSNITPAPSGTDIKLLLAFTTATCNNLQRHQCWYVWSPRPVHAPYPGPPPSALGSGCTASSKALVSPQVFHQSVGWCTSGLEPRLR